MSTPCLTQKRHPPQHIIKGREKSRVFTRWFQLNGGARYSWTLQVEMIGPQLCRRQIIPISIPQLQLAGSSQRPSAWIRISSLLVKLRLGLAQVGNDTDPYRLNAIYNASNPYGNNPMYSLTNTMPPLDLVNELITSQELGLDLRFFQSRLGLDFTIYKSVAKKSDPECSSFQHFGV